MNAPRLPSGLFVTGTDTHVGKTHVACIIVRSLRAAGLRVGAYKPACSGALMDSRTGAHWEDIDRLRDALDQDLPDDVICPQRFLAPVAPPVAARAEGRDVDADLLISGLEWWRGLADIVVVEGAGGLLSPMTETETVADLAQALGFPLIVVARCGLGTINHSLLTVEAARRRNLIVAGLVLNQSHPNDDRLLAEDNAREIESRGAVSVLGLIDWGSGGGLHRHGSPVTIPWRDFANHR